MLPPVFYVQQLEQILLRKLLSPPTPAARPLRPRAAPRAYIRIQFFRSLFSCRAMSLWSRASALRAAVFSCTPRPSFPPHLRLYLYSVFCSLFSCRAMSLWPRVSALRARRTYINIQFLSAPSISGHAPLALRSSYSVFSFFRFSSTRISAGFMIFSYGESTSNHL